MRFLDNVLQDYIERAPDEMARAKYSRRARALGRPRRDGLPLLPAGARHRRSKGAMAKIVEPARSSSISAPRPTRPRCCSRSERGPCPDAADRGVMERFSLQDGDRADRVDQHHLRRHLGLHRADPGQHLHPQDAVGLASRSATRISRSCSRASRRTATGVWSTRSSSTAARSSISTSSPPRRRTSSRPASRSTSAGCSNSPPTARPISTRRSR